MKKRLIVPKVHPFPRPGVCARIRGIFLYGSCGERGARMGPGMGSFFSSLSVGCVMTRTGAPVGEIWGAGWVGGTIFGDIIIV